MSRAHTVRATKRRQQGAAVKQRKPGKPYNGPNLVAPREPSSNKAARKAAAASRRKTAE
jgi:hypothetical protein